MRRGVDAVHTDAGLLVRLRNLEDNESWQTFFDTYWPVIHHTARRAGLRDAEADDVLQETLISICRKLPSFQYDGINGSFRAYLLQTTKWRIADQFRRRDVQPVAGQAIEVRLDDEDLQDTALAVSPELEAAWDHEWEESIVETAQERTQRRVDPGLYQAFDLYVRKGWSASRVAQALDIPVETVYSAKHEISRVMAREIQRLRGTGLD